MASKIRLRAKIKADGIADIKTLIKHAMETGNRKHPETGALVPAHYILQLNCALNGTEVLTANWGPAVSKNPYFSFKLKGAKVGDMVRISWTDNLGQQDALEQALK
jgi:sulfur-oxidizing protein SoxZ